MNSKSLRRLLVTFASILTLVLALAPATFAGEDDGGDNGDSTPVASGGGGGGGGDTGSARGGVQTGLGGVIATSDGSMTIPFALAGGGAVLLTLAGGLTSRRRRVDQ